MNKENDSKKKPETLKELAVSVLIYNTASILGPLLFFGIIGFGLDYYFDTKPVFILISLAIAFISTNIFMLKRVKKLMDKYEQDNSEQKTEDR